MSKTKHRDPAYLTTYQLNVAFDTKKLNHIHAIDRGIEKIVGKHSDEGGMDLMSGVRDLSFQLYWDDLHKVAAELKKVKHLTLTAWDENGKRLKL